jgi:hypothetical protein
LVAATDGFFFLASSSEDSESDEDSFFLLFEREAGGAFLIAGVTETLVGVAGACFLLVGGATLSESELELLDGAVLRLRSTLTGCAGVTAAFVLAGGFLSSSSDEEDDDESFFFLFPLLKAAAGVGTDAFLTSEFEPSFVDFVCICFFVVTGSSSSESSLLDDDGRDTFGRAVAS